MEALKQLVDSGGRGHSLIKLIGIREQEAFKAARLALLDVLKEGIVEGSVCGGIHQLVIVAYSLLVKFLEYLIHTIAFREGYLLRHHRARAGGHFLYERLIVIDRLELICAGVDLLICVIH